MDNIRKETYGYDSSLAKIASLANDDIFYDEKKLLECYEIISALKNIYMANKALNKFGYTKLNEDNIINDFICPNAHYIKSLFF